MRTINIQMGRKNPTYLCIQRVSAILIPQVNSIWQEFWRMATGHMAREDHLCKSNDSKTSFK
jgi:hypothetical protein